LKRHGFELGAHGGGQSAFTRFERARPNELWQMDFKGTSPCTLAGFIR
jgi:hypothetical protein